MEKETTKAILVVSFGTSYNDTRAVTIDAIEEAIAKAFPDCKVYRAWTSRKIIAKLKKRDGIHIHTIEEAMITMEADGITDVVVQPTHVINGIENDQMKEEVLAYRDRFHSIRFGAPLLTSDKDQKALVQAIASEFHELRADEVLVLMGHGTMHEMNSVYETLDCRFKDMGYQNIFLGTVEAYPGIETLLRTVKKLNPVKVTLAPFMIVAGDHAKNDMAGDEPKSWMNQFKRAGFEVDTVLKGLGEYEGIRQLLVEHAKRAI
jgi:sirohydrochlorin cobaltochelatase